MVSRAFRKSFSVQEVDDDDTFKLVTSPVKLGSLRMKKQVSAQIKDVIQEEIDESEQMALSNLEDLILVKETELQNLDLTPERRHVMETQIMARLECNEQVAKYALMMTDYAGADAAYAYLFDKDDTGFRRHKFLGYKKPKKMDLLRLGKDCEKGESDTICFLCQGEEHDHPDDEK